MTTPWSFGRHLCGTFSAITTNAPCLPLSLRLQKQIDLGDEPQSGHPCRRPLGQEGRNQDQEGGDLFHRQEQQKQPAVGPAAPAPEAARGPWSDPGPGAAAAVKAVTASGSRSAAAHFIYDEFPTDQRMDRASFRNYRGGGVAEDAKAARSAMGHAYIDAGLVADGIAKLTQNPCSGCSRRCGVMAKRPNIAGVWVVGLSISRARSALSRGHFQRHGGSARRRGLTRRQFVLFTPCRLRALATPRRTAS